MDAIREFMHGAVVWLAGAVLWAGYGGIVFLMAIESSFIPFPSEVVIPPAGYQIHQGRMTWFGVVAAGTFGSLVGAWVNYFIAAKIGRAVFVKYGKYFFISEANIEKTEKFFRDHGEITMFVGRLVPVIRQLISLPAGLARMNLLKFSVYTALGAAIWIVVLTWIGYFIGQTLDVVDASPEGIGALAKQYLPNIVAITLGAAAVVVGVYVALHRRRKAAAAAGAKAEAAPSVEVAPERSADVD